MTSNPTPPRFSVTIPDNAIKIGPNWFAAPITDAGTNTWTPPPPGHWKHIGTINGDKDTE